MCIWVSQMEYNGVEKVVLAWVSSVSDPTWFLGRVH